MRFGVAVAHDDRRGAGRRQFRTVEVRRRRRLEAESGEIGGRDADEGRRVAVEHVAAVQGKNARSTVVGRHHVRPVATVGVGRPGPVLGIVREARRGELVEEPTARHGISGLRNVDTEVVARCRELRDHPAIGVAIVNHDRVAETTGASPGSQAFHIEVDQHVGRGLGLVEDAHARTAVAVDRLDVVVRPGSARRIGRVDAGEADSVEVARRYRKRRVGAFGLILGNLLLSDDQRIVCFRIAHRIHARLGIEPSRDLSHGISRFPLHGCRQISKVAVEPLRRYRCRFLDLCRCVPLHVRVVAAGVGDAGRDDCDGHCSEREDAPCTRLEIHLRAPQFRMDFCFRFQRISADAAG